jgi:glycosyltransferase involved in cell wall biosynthesis
MWPDAAISVGALRPGRSVQLMLRLEAWAYRHARLITTVTDGVRDKLVRDKGVPADKILMLTNGVDTDLFKPRAGAPARRTALGLPDGPFVIYAGTMGLAHGLDPLLDAFARLDADRDPFLLLIGAGSERPRLERRAAAEGLSNVIFRDPIPLEELAELMPLATIGAVTSANIPINEFSRPAKLFPVMACALPVLFAGGGEGANLVESSSAGMVVPNEPAAIADATRRLMSDRDAARRMGDNGREVVERDWSWKGTVERWRHDLAASLGIVDADSGAFAQKRREV